MKILHLPDVNKVLHKIIVGTNGVFPVNAQSEPGDKIPGIYQMIIDTVQNTNTPASVVNIVSSTVPTGVIWTIEHVTIQYTGTIAGRTYYLYLIDPSGYVILDTFTDIGAIGFHFYHFPIHMLPGSYIQFTVANAENGKTMTLRIGGYNMRVPTVFT